METLQNFVLRRCEQTISKSFPNSFFALGAEKGKPYMVTSSHIHDFTGWWDLIKFTIRGIPRRKTSELAEKIWFFNLILTAAVAAYMMM